MNELKPVHASANQWLAPATPEQLTMFNLRGILATLRRRWLIVVSIVAVGIAGGGAWLSRQRTLYSAEVGLMLDAKKVVLRDIPTVLSGVTLDFPLVRGEVQTLQSWLLADKVVRNLNIVSHPEYANINAHEGLLESLGLERFLPLALLGMGREPSPPSVEQIIAAFLRNLSVITDGRSYAIWVRFASTDPTLAAAAANEVAQVYISAKLEAKADTLQKLNLWLIERTDELRKKARSSDLAVRRFRAENNLADFKGAPVNQQQISDLSGQLILAASERAQKEARLRQVRHAAKTDAAGNIHEVLNSPLIQRLREQEAQVLRRDAELSTRYGDKHPQIIAVRAELGDLKQKIAKEIQKAIQGVAAEADIARAREATLQSNLEILNRQAAVANPAEGRLAELELEAETNRKVLDAFLTRVKETSGQEDFQGADVKIISPAWVPTMPASPQRGLVLAISAGVALILGTGAAFLVDRLDDGVHSLEQLERRVAIACLGLIPRVRGPAPRLADAILLERRSLFAEAVRSLRAVLTISTPLGMPKVTLVTSPVAQEGKSLLALSLARTVALEGRKTLLIDCNLRQPAIASMLQAPSGDGLDAFIRHPAYESRSIGVDEASGLHYLATGSMNEKAHEALESPMFGQLIDHARRHYEIVILDAPGFAEVSDPLLLLPHADAIVMAIQWRKTSLRSIERAMRKLMYGRGRLLGVVMTQVNESAFIRHLKGQDMI